MNKNEKEKCQYCLYLAIVALFFMFMTFAIPNFDRLIVRDIMGSITALSSIIGIGLCAYIFKFLSPDNRELTIRIKHVYIMTGFIFLCTAGMGILGIIAPSTVMSWDLLYSFRTLAIILEVVAVGRFISYWIKVGK